MPKCDIVFTLGDTPKSKLIRRIYYIRLLSSRDIRTEYEERQQ